MKYFFRISHADFGGKTPFFLSFNSINNSFILICLWQGGTEHCGYFLATFIYKVEVQECNFFFGMVYPCLSFHFLVCVFFNIQRC